METVLVLNADLGPLHRVSRQHAIRMLYREVAEIHEPAEEHISGVDSFELLRQLGELLKLTTIRLVRYVVPKWRYTEGPAWSRAGVLNRDRRRCGYCGGHATTVDHVRPRSRGGANTWINTVASCDPCNQRKGNRTPIEAGMTLLVRPIAPTWSTVVRH